jgi:puromycin-sensitive aminopeptidase
MSTNPTTVDAGSQYRLPTSVIPSFYDIRIEPDIKGGKHFHGSERIMVEVHQPVTEIVLNAAEMTINEAVLTDDAGTKLVGRATVDDTTERAVIKFDGEVGTGHWELDLKFTGTFNPKLKGFYLSRYKHEGKDEVIATTKFEPCDARRAFPCWDEPAFKARFKVSLAIDEDLNAICNARLLKTTPVEGGKKLLEFAPSIKMSTYLVAYVIGKLEASEPVVTADGIPIRVWCVPGKSHMAPFALSAAKYSLEYFHRYFNQPYPGDKLDLVAIPDFASGAMENFACITFRETALLVDTKTASHAELQRVGEVVMHENAHMWFGDFTTMSWWNGLWLNEAFATFMASKCVDAWKPEWKFWEGFNIEKAAAMRVDGLRSTRSIEFPVHNPDEARGMFDVLTYEKGCAILRMLELFLGEDEFRNGIVAYIAKHAFGNADTPDLWAAIEQMTPSFSETVTAGSLMDTWVFQPGFPVVHVEESEVSGSVKLTQSIFRYLGDNAPDTLWHIPVHLRATVRGDDGKPTTIEKVVLLSKGSETFYLGEDLSSVVVNAGGHGFYRVRYEPKLLAKLLDTFGTLSAGERFNFVNDLWASVQSGQTPLPQYVDTVAAITGKHGEMDVNVFTVIVGSLNTMRRIVPRNDENTRGLLHLANELAGPALAKLGMKPKEGESSQEGQLRAMLVGLLGVFGDAQVKLWAKDSYGRYKADKTSVDGNLVGAMLETLAAHGDAALYDEFVARKQAASTPQEETKFLFALTGFKDPALATRTLKGAVDGTIRTQDAPMVIQRVLSNAATAKLAWDFVKENWDKMVSLYPVQGITRLSDAASTLVGDDIPDDVGSFLTSHAPKASEKSVKQTLEQQQIALSLKARERQTFQASLTATK